jgi:hypothetical protein
MSVHDFWVWYSVAGLATCAIFYFWNLIFGDKLVIGLDYLFLIIGSILAGLFWWLVIALMIIKGFVGFSYWLNGLVRR